ncbi:hypothetical protein [Muricoccus radiodurans]|uniref:hypothetical protein n=1 Tax=Muricoccus radiodurans TaxID=2231721 RepID=UPI003CF72E4C
MSTMERAIPPPAPEDMPFTQPTGPTAPDANPLQDWYFCVNGEGLRREFRFIRAAVASARRNTTLRPHCLYDGPACAELDWLQAAGVRVIPHAPSLEPELREAYGDQYETFRGHWLRLDIPMLETAAESALYTDIDVLFLRDPRAFAFSPRYVAVCEEGRIGERNQFNSGVMVMNLPALRAVRPWMLRDIRHRLVNDFRPAGHDQKSLNEFLLTEADWMDPAFNWKPHWGPNADAVIVHFHGPKPVHVARIRDGQADRMKPAYKILHDRSPEGYDAFIAVHDTMLAAAEELVPWPART